MIVSQIPKEYSDNCGIYSLTNTINGKRLIGSTVNFRKRLIMYHHKFKYNKMHNQHIYNSLKHYGLDKFKFELITLCDNENLREMEEYYCMSFNTFDRKYGYNMSIPTRPGELSIETRKKISINRSGIKLNDKQKKHMSNVQKLYWKTKEGKEARLKQKESLKLFYASKKGAEVAKKHSLYMKELNRRKHERIS